MSETEKKPVNPAKLYLMRYLDARAMRRQLMDAGDDAQAVHALQIEAYAQTMRDVLAMINRLEHPRQREVLTMRYINGWTWRRIVVHMETMGYSESLCYQLHGRALQIINRMLEREAKP